MPVCQEELSRRVGPAGRDVGQQRCGGALGRRHEWILRGAPPGDEAELGIVVGGASQVREGHDRVLEEHDAEARDDRVEVRRREGVGLRVGAHEACRRAFRLGACIGRRRSSAPKCRCRCSGRWRRAAAQRRASCCPHRSRRRAHGALIRRRPLRRVGLRTASAPGRAPLGPRPRRVRRGRSTAPPARLSVSCMASMSVSFAALKKREAGLCHFKST